MDMSVLRVFLCCALFAATPKAVLAEEENTVRHCSDIWRCRQLNTHVQRAVVADCQRACDAGDAEACKSWAARFEREGCGVSVDLLRAVALYEKACALGSMDACSSAAQLYRGWRPEPTRDYGSQQPPIDHAKEVALYERACNLKNRNVDTVACRELSDLLMDGKFITRNPKRAIILLEYLCQNHARDGVGSNACSDLVGIFSDGTKKNRTRARFYERKLADARGGE